MLLLLPSLVLSPQLISAESVPETLSTCTIAHQEQERPNRIQGLLCVDGNEVKQPLDKSDLLNRSEWSLSGYPVDISPACDLICCLDIKTTNNREPHEVESLALRDHVLRLASESVHAECLLSEELTDETKSSIGWVTNPLMSPTGNLNLGIVLCATEFGSGTGFFPGIMTTGPPHTQDFYVSDFAAVTSINSSGRLILCGVPTINNHPASITPRVVAIIDRGCVPLVSCTFLYALYGHFDIIRVFQDSTPISFVYTSATTSVVQAGIRI